MSGLRYESAADMPAGMREIYQKSVVTRNGKPTDIAACAHKREKSKYYNIKMEVNGIRFDSKKEANRYLALLDAVAEGVISDLRLQQEYTLQEAFMTTEGERIPAIRYRADFVYRISGTERLIPISIGISDVEYWRELQPGTVVIEDVKSVATSKSKEYRIKRKMMAERGYHIREV